MVFASIREHAEHCDFFVSSSRNKKFAFRACEQGKHWGSTSKRALVYILRANRAKVKFCEQLKILMDQSSPLTNSKNLFWRIKSDPGLFRVSLLMASRSKFAKMHISSYSVTGWLKSCNNLIKHLKYQKDNSSWQLYALSKNLTNRLESDNHYNPWVNAGIWQDGENYNSLITIKIRLRVVIPVFLSGKTSWFTIMLCVSISDLVSSCTSLSVS